MSSSKTQEYTIDELMVTCMARQLFDGDIVAQGIATPMATVAYLLAQKTHAPNLYFMSAIGQGICKEPAQISISHIEKLWLDKAMTTIGFVRAALEALPTIKPKEFFRPAQIDSCGNFNNIAFGTNYKRPRFRLPGTGGIPDVTTYIPHSFFYVPRHSKITFVKTLDYLSGLGYKQENSQGIKPRYLVSNLGQFDFANGRMRLISIHPGVTIRKIINKTGFDLEIPEKIKETPPPSERELYLLRHEVDPLDTRKLEMLSGARRKELLRKIIEKENLHANQ